MIVYTYSEARQDLASLLETAMMDADVLNRRKDGQVFVVRPQTQFDSPLDIERLNLGITANEILEFIQEGRRP